MPSNPPAAAEATNVFSPSEVLCRTSVAESEPLLGELVRLLAARDKAIDPEPALRAVLDREAEAPTFIAPGVAMPHARLEGIDDTYAAVATSAQTARQAPAPPRWTQARLGLTDPARRYKISFV